MFKLKKTFTSELDKVLAKSRQATPQSKSQQYEQARCEYVAKLRDS
jgi:hypothetical protein